MKNNHNEMIYKTKATVYFHFPATKKKNVGKIHKFFS
jgi:hypothetical protein